MTRAQYATLIMPTPRRRTAQALVDGHRTDAGIPMGMALALLLMLSVCGASLSQAGEIAILTSSDLPAYAQAIAGFKITAPGSSTYVEYDLGGDPEEGKKLARRIRASGASLVLAVGLKAALAAQAQIPDIPILYMMILDPAKHRLAAPNITGTLLDIPAEQQFKVLRSFLPGLHRLGALFDPNKSSSQIKEAAAQAAANGFQLQTFAVGSEKDIPQQLRTLLTTTEGLWLTPDSTVLTAESIHFILESAMARHVPVIGFSPELTRLGALLSISVSYHEVGRETGMLAKRLLNGERALSIKPLPIERVTITVNQKTANFLGITFSPELDRLIDDSY